MATVSLIIDGVERVDQADGAMTLARFLGDVVGARTPVGCHAGACGACTVLVSRNGVDFFSVKSCLMLAAQASDFHVLTYDGLLASRDVRWQALQKLGIEDILQCGFCGPGLVANIVDLLADGTVSEEILRHGLRGNLCRCTGYDAILRALLASAAADEASKKTGF